MIRFSRYMVFYFLISACILVPGLYSLATHGLRPSIDFTGGSVLEITTEKEIPSSSIEAIGNTYAIVFTGITREQNNTYLLQMKPSEEAVIDALQKDLGKEGGALVVLRRDTVGPVIGKELLTKAITAALLAMVAILCYVAYAFKNITFGVSAVVALLHDVLIVCSVFSLFGWFFGVEVDTLFVTAFLTTMSFSVHDTIVIFDRIREYRKRDQEAPLSEISDIALTETMGRSLVNSFTIIFMLLALVLMGGETIRWFAVALLIGTVTGTYSSPFIATPTLILLDRWKRKK